MGRGRPPATALIRAVSSPATNASGTVAILISTRSTCPLADRVLQHGELARRSLGDGDNCLVGADGVCGDLDAVEDEMRHETEENLVFAARRLSLDAVREHDLPSAAAADRAELQRGRKAGAAAAAQLAPFDGVEERLPIEPSGQRSVQVQMLEARHRPAVSV